MVFSKAYMYMALLPPSPPSLQSLDVVAALLLLVLGNEQRAFWMLVVFVQARRGGGRSLGGHSLGDHSLGGRSVGGRSVGGHSLGGTQ